MSTISAEYIIGAGASFAPMMFREILYHGYWLKTVVVGDAVLAISSYG
jgi:hypothetical protein